MDVENNDVKRINNQMMERVKDLEFQSMNKQKENEDLRYDNTVLYQRSVENDEKIESLNE